MGLLSILWVRWLKPSGIATKKVMYCDGVSYYYNQKGYLDSMTTWLRGRKNGDSWKLSGDSLKDKMKYLYLNDSLIEVIDLTKQKKGFNGIL